MYAQTYGDILSRGLSGEEKLALKKLKDADLERALDETPGWIKILWVVILGGLFYYLSKLT